MTTSTASTIPARTVLEIRAALVVNGRILDDIDVIIRELQGDRHPDARIDGSLKQACDLSTHACGIHADLYDELLVAEAYERHLDDTAEAERVLAEYRLDQRL